MSNEACSDPKLSDAYTAAFVEGATVVVTLSDGTQHEIPYDVSDDVSAGRASEDEDDPRIKVAFALRYAFFEHRKNCEACRLNYEEALRKLTGG